MSSYRWIAAHRSMAFDEVRNPAYFKTIREHVDDTSTVLDLGTGVGVLGLEAARCGARKVYLVDPEPVVHLARDISQANGISDRVEIICSGIENARLPEPADLILSVFTGNFLLDEDLLPLLFLARDRFLKPGGKLIPDRARMEVAPVQANEYYSKYIGVWGNGADHLLRYPGLADFHVNLQQSSIHCYPDAGVAQSTLRHLLLDQVLPRFVGQSGRLIVHASAVAHRSQAIIFLGRSGWGKSTLAAFFADGTQRQFSDDVLLLQMEHESRARAVTSYQGMRLWPDAIRALFDREPRSEEVTHYSDKKRLFLPEVARAGETSLPLRAIFILNDPVTEESRDIIIRPLHGVDAIMALVRRTFIMDPREMGPVQKIFKCAGDVVRTDIPLSWIGYPRVRRACKGQNSRSRIQRLAAICCRQRSTGRAARNSAINFVEWLIFKIIQGLYRLLTMGITPMLPCIQGKLAVLNERSIIDQK